METKTARQKLVDETSLAEFELAWHVHAASLAVEYRRKERTLARYFGSASREYLANYRRLKALEG